LFINNIPHDLGVFADNKKVYLFSHALTKGSDTLHVGVSSDGLNFRSFRKIPVITNDVLENEDTRFCSDFRISHLPKKYVLLYKFNLGSKAKLNLAYSKDGIRFKKKTLLNKFSDIAMIVPDFFSEKHYFMYHGQGDLYLSSSTDLLNWESQKIAVLSPRVKYFDNHPIILGSVILTAKGILILYYVKKRQREGDRFLIGAALFDKKHPESLLWRSDKPLWEQLDIWKNEAVYPMGAVFFKERLFLYFGVEGNAVYAVSLGKLHDLLEQREHYTVLKLTKHPHNPIISPVLKHIWEANATFNAAAIYEAGKVHFVYRAMGPYNTSVLGYASSNDGIHIDERLSQPIYVPTEPFEVPGKIPSISYMSGGGYGGCEDPRLTRIDDTLYMTYVAYNGIDPPKIALTTIKLDDFINKRWIWSKPKVISSPNDVNKNCVIFPEKINGKYAVMHRVFPAILIDFVDDLNFNNNYLTGQHAINPRRDSWDSRKLGAGAPPIKTKDGWLLIYQAVDERDPGKYKIGAMLLDLNNPVKILHRPHTPILEPTEWYENEGFKAGVTYPCGAVIKEEHLFVYYGGADTVICVASAPLDPFLKQLKESTEIRNIQKPTLHKIPNYLFTN
jgi:beta-1,2-mannobiose phosphorylase / 1,2-beta-oligomannan phosphorylase